MCLNINDFTLQCENWLTSGDCFLAQRQCYITLYQPAKQDNFLGLVLRNIVTACKTTRHPWAYYCNYLEFILF